MTFMPDAHRPKAADEAGCWAGGNFACDAPASEPLGLCDRHRAEVTSDEPRPAPEPFPEMFGMVTVAEALEAVQNLARRFDATMWIADELPQDEGERVFGRPTEFSDMPDSWPADPWEDA